MDGSRFDTLAKTLAAVGSRRQALGRAAHRLPGAPGGGTNRGGGGPQREEAVPEEVRRREEEVPQEGQEAQPPARHADAHGGDADPDGWHCGHPATTCAAPGDLQRHGQEWQRERCRLRRAGLRPLRPRKELRRRGGLQHVLVYQQCLHGVRHRRVPHGLRVRRRSLRQQHPQQGRRLRRLSTLLVLRSRRR